MRGLHPVTPAMVRQMEEKVERTRDFERFVTFIDAVVAIAITLLVLPLVDISSQLNGGSVAQLLRDHSVEILGFLLSFLVISSLWFSQHHALRNVIAHDTLVTRLMMAWTLTIVVLPFPTALVAEAGSQATTKVVYIGTMTLSSALLAVICWAIGRNRAIRDSDASPDPAPSVASTICFLLALVVSLSIPGTSYYPLLLLFLARPPVTLWHHVRRRSRAT